MTQPLAPLLSLEVSAQCVKRASVSARNTHFRALLLRPNGKLFVQSSCPDPQVRLRKARQSCPVEQVLLCLSRLRRSPIRRLYGGGSSVHDAHVCPFFRIGDVLRRHESHRIRAWRLLPDARAVHLVSVSVVKVDNKVAGLTSTERTRPQNTRFVAFLRRPGNVTGNTTPTQSPTWTRSSSKAMLLCSPFLLVTVCALLVQSDNQERYCTLSIPLPQTRALRLPATKK